MRRIAIALCLAMLPLAPARSQDDPTRNPAVQKAFITCAAYWGWMADFARSQGKPATGDYFHGYENGARFSALWLIAATFNTDHPETQRQVGDFAVMVDGPIELEKTRIMSLAENGEQGQLDEIGKICIASTKAADLIIQQARAGMIGQP